MIDNDSRTILYFYISAITSIMRKDRKYEYFNVLRLKGLKIGKSILKIDNFVIGSTSPYSHLGC